MLRMYVISSVLSTKAPKPSTLPRRRFACEERQTLSTCCPEREGLGFRGGFKEV